MILYKNTKVKVRSPDGDIDSFDIVTGVLQGDTLAPYLLIIYLNGILQKTIDLMKENILTLKKARSRRYPTGTITNTDYADDSTSANTPALAEFLPPTPYYAADKTKYMYFNQIGDISTLNGGPLKLVDKFIYLGSSVSSSENDINTQLAKAWTAIDRLSVIWKSNLSDEIKRHFFQAAVVSILLYGCTTWMLTECIKKKFGGSCSRMIRAILNKSWK